MKSDKGDKTLEYLDYVKKINIGDIELLDNIFLAPMAGVTDKAFRYITKKYSDVSYTITEMVSIKGLVYNDKKTHKIMDMAENESPKIVQVFGSDIEALKKVILKFNDLDSIDIIDINMGCPAKKVTKNGDGSEILKNLDMVKEVISVATSLSKKPITVKTRTGYYKGKITAIDVAKIAEKYGVSLMTVHGRTKEDGYTGKVDLDTIKKVKESVKIPVVASGDITSIKDAYNTFSYTGVDGIMVGRAALGNPWIFKSLKEGIEYVPSKEELLKVIIEHIEVAVSYGNNEETEIKKLRKHISWYLKGLKNSSYIKEKINKELKKDNVIALLKEYFKKEYNASI